ncbi:hypothetical protein HNR00_000639 [Methylorubrum rhodinum]|uniref:Glycosyltransferase 61 catalytic domain-containing protein n=1 Tax=Methylorubrum rhodinum TaxID=29428 RepID=A0A840ZGD4_9HYPH|nr:glycosyltransferase family 61 protein [Methylorubrum rhodinum]MBB5755943.1 hypothetical protein [Methylorubrum rhodinum]
MAETEETDFAAGELRDAVLNGRGRCTDLSLSHRARVPPPDLTLGAVHAELMRVYFDQPVVLGTSLYELPDAEVLAEGVVVLDGALQYCSQLNLFPVDSEPRFRALSARRPGLRRESVAEPVVLLTGPGHHMYGHWLVDFLPKLFLLDRAGHDIARLRYLLPADTPDFARTWLALLGIGPDRILPYDRERDRLACARLLVPTGLRFNGRAAPLMREAARFLLDRLAPRPRWRLGRRRVDRPVSRRLLIARSDNAVTHNRRTLVERADLEARASARGFEVVRPERLSVADQVALFRSAETILGEYGSGLHASLLANPGASVVALRDNGLDAGFLQTSLDHALGHASGYVFGTARDAEGFFSVRPQDIDLALDWLDLRGPR